MKRIVLSILLGIISGNCLADGWIKSIGDYVGYKTIAGLAVVGYCSSIIGIRLSYKMQEDKVGLDEYIKSTRVNIVAYNETETQKQLIDGQKSKEVIDFISKNGVVFSKNAVTETAGSNLFYKAVITRGEIENDFINNMMPEKREKFQYKELKGQERLTCWLPTMVAGIGTASLLSSAIFGTAKLTSKIIK